MNYRDIKKRSLYVVAAAMMFQVYGASAMNDDSDGYSNDESKEAPVAEHHNPGIVHDSGDSQWSLLSGVGQVFRTLLRDLTGQGRVAATTSNAESQASSAAAASAEPAEPYVPLRLRRPQVPQQEVLSAEGGGGEPVVQHSDDSTVEEAQQHILEWQFRLRSRTWDGASAGAANDEDCKESENVADFEWSGEEAIDVAALLPVSRRTVERKNRRRALEQQNQSLQKKFEVALSERLDRDIQKGNVPKALQWLEQLEGICENNYDSVRINDMCCKAIATALSHKQIDLVDAVLSKRDDDTVAHYVTQVLISFLKAIEQNPGCPEALLLKDEQVQKCLMKYISRRDAKGETFFIQLLNEMHEQHVSPDLIHVLLDMGIFIDTENTLHDRDLALFLDETTALNIFGLEGKADVVQSLLQNRANVEHADRTGRTPIFLAVSARCYNPAIIRMLIFANTNVNRYTYKYPAICHLGENSRFGNYNFLGTRAIDFAESMGKKEIIEAAIQEKEEALQSLHTHISQHQHLSGENLESEVIRFIGAIAQKPGAEYSILAQTLHDAWLKHKSALGVPFYLNQPNIDCVERIAPPQNMESLPNMIACAAKDGEQLMIHWLLKGQDEEAPSCSICTESINDCIKMGRAITRVSDACFHCMCVPCWEMTESNNDQVPISQRLVPICPTCKVFAGYNQNPLDLPKADDAYLLELFHNRSAEEQSILTEYQESLVSFIDRKVELADKHQPRYRKLKEQFYTAMRADEARERRILEQARAQSAAASEEEQKDQD